MGDMDQMWDSMTNLEFITLTCPDTSDPMFHESPMEVEDDERDELLRQDSPAPSLELEEREVLLLLDSPTSSPPSTPAPPPASNTPHPYGATDIRTMTEEERAAKKRAKKALKKKKSRKRAKK